ncbi:hypothetical protein [Enterococcus faecium]|uniref:hypothetical protein n=1 Tax=Enterococcus TaxID=1350 RepID=UPI00223C21C0|nr:hypothetical protein [Enterococcus faecium]MCS8594094.1 hypothetical protein [Enterococcus faecium]
MKIKNWLVFSSILLVLVGLGGYWFVHEKKALSQEQMSLKQQKQAFNEQKSDQKQVISELRSSIQKLEKEKSVLKEANEVLKNNDASEKGNLQQFNEIVGKAFHALFDYDPNTFSERKQACEPYLSKDLMDQYFKEDKYYGDSNGVSSELEACTLYTKSVQSNELKGLVVVEYQNKIGNSSWNKAMNVFQVTYNLSSKKLIAIQNLGSSFNGSLLE